MIILGIETSCDETGAAILEQKNGRIQILSNILSTSASLQAKYGGIIPEQAAREQIKAIIPVIETALLEAFEVGNEKWDLEVRNFDILKSRNQNIKKSKSKNSHISLLTSKIDAIAVTYGPGLIGSLLVGVETAKVLVTVWNKPLIPVNHLIGHFYANWISPAHLRGETKTTPGAHLGGVPDFPCLGLLVSGGHTDLVLFTDHGKYKYLGGTRDDAAGECFDKCARLLGLPYPGGPAIAQSAMKFKIQNSKFKIELPRPLIIEKTFDFSFSGLKTAVSREVEHLKTKKQFNNATIQQLSFEVQEAIIDVLVEKTIKAAKKYNVGQIMVAGGVAANQKLVQSLQSSVFSLQSDIKLHIPPPQLCTDNGAMIAAAGFFEKKRIDPIKLQANPNLSLD